MIVNSFGTLQSVATKDAGSIALDTTGHGSSWFEQMNAATYQAIYRTQPNVRTVVDFIARNVAQIGLHAYRRVSDLDRVRLSDHELLLWLERPNPGVSRYRLFDSLMQDLGIHMNAYWLKIRKADKSLGLVRLPPEQMFVEGWLVPSGYTWTLPDGRRAALPRESVVHFGGYDPHNPIMGLSPLETLRGILTEDAAQNAYRQNYWQKAARIDGVVTRPAGAPKWTNDQRQAFREQWQQKYTGASSVSTVVLEDGMNYVPNSFSARDSEFVPARKLTREEVAAAYHVPLPLVGILDHATFSNIKEQHKHLYQDCLGPWLTMLVGDLERQLLPEAKDTTDVYLEFNIAEKLKGSFEEQAQSLYYMVGRPMMTANEGRARLNLPRLDDPSADQIALPLNTAAGPSPSPPSAPTPEPAAATRLLPTDERLVALAALIDEQMRAA